MILHDEAEELLQILIRWATGEHQEGDEERYIALRAVLRGASESTTRLPELVVKCRTLQHFWEEIKPRYSTYAERRRYLRESFSSLLDHLEAEHAAPGSDIPEHVRRDIFDELRNVWWPGRLDEVTFLNRLYDLDKLPSHDGRFRTAVGDIRQHRINNEDWEPDWVFADERFQLLKGPAEIFLRFLAEMIHPTVRADADSCETLREQLNAHLAPAGWCLLERRKSAGRPVYGPCRLGQGHKNTQRIREVFNTVYVHAQIRRMEEAAQDDPDLAIGTAKELIETSCRSILEKRGITVQQTATVPELLKLTTKSLRLLPDDISPTQKGAEEIRKVLHGLGSIAHHMAELRNLYGSGHGRVAKSKALQPRHARLAVGAASTLAAFLVEVHELREGENDGATRPTHH